VLQAPASFRRFRRRVQAMPFSEVEWREARQWLGKDPAGREQKVERAVRFFVLCRQSLAGRGEDFAVLSRARTRRGMNEQASAWLRAIDGLPAVHQRLRRVVLLSRPALEVIQTQDGPETLFYLDPPYLPETKTAGVFGPLEMTPEQHAELLDAVTQVRGKVMLSGYPSRLYDDRLAGWHRHEFRLPNQAAAGALKRNMTEVLWCNFPAEPMAGQPASMTGPHTGRRAALPA
jgi:DNA adenine methylase